VKVIVGVQVGGNLYGEIPCVGARVTEFPGVLQPARSIVNSKEVNRILSFTFALNSEAPNELRIDAAEKDKDITEGTVCRHINPS
jgi:hypothetical protein